jgi:hypothetical protein
MTAARGAFGWREVFATGWRKAVKNNDPLEVSRRFARWIVAVAAILPLLLFLLNGLTTTYGPSALSGHFIHPLGNPSPYLLNYWNVLSVVAAMLLVIPGSFMAYRLRGVLAASSLLVWMMSVAYVAYFINRAIQ